jgi:hypothetical protein
MSERVNVDRQQGDPLVFSVDLKHALWSKDRDYWQEYAPNTLAHLIAGFDGAFDEHGDTIVIETAPRKEIRFGKVVLDPKAGTVTVTFNSEFDDDADIQGVWESDEFPLPETLDEFLALVDDAEARLIAKEEAA